MSVSPHEHIQWQELNERVTSDGLALNLRRNPIDGSLAAVALNAEGVISFEGKRALEAFDHPSVTPGIETGSPQGSPWDAALDAYNRLPLEDREWAMIQFNHSRSDLGSWPVLLFDAVRRQRRQRGIDKAA